MRVHLLGGFEVEGLAERSLGSRKGRTLLKLLALSRGRPVTAGRIAEVLWGDQQPSRPADQVGVLVSRLRGVVGAERMPRTDDGYALLVDWLDVDEVAQLADAAAAALAEGRTTVARVAAGAALDLARGPLLADEDGDWVDGERAAAAAIVARVRRLAVDAAMAVGDHDGAVAAAEVALAGDPYDEAVLRSSMRAHLAARRPASALAAYARTRRRLVEDLGVSPTAETESLHATALEAADGTAAQSAALHHTDDRAALVGRGVELAALDAALRGAAAGAMELVVVEGDAGIGKTTLVTTWAATVGDAAAVLRGRCDALGRDLPLQPVVDAIADHLRMLGAERARELVRDDADTLAPLLGPVAGSTATVVPDTDTARARLFAALLALLDRAGQGAPVVLALDDLHLAGPSTIAWLHTAQRRGHRLLLVATTRPGGANTLQPTRRLRLGPLDLDAVTSMVGAERAHRLLERSGGHPLLLSALATSSDDDLPETLREAVAAEIDSLGTDVAATVRLAAILGPDCDLDLLAQVAGADVVALLDHLEAATTAGVLAERGSRFEFRHELVREAVEAGTGAARRALAHQLAARGLAARSRPDPLAVALHALAGGDTELAARWFLAAGAAAADRFDPETADADFSRSIELAPNAEAYTARARLRMATGRHAEGAGDAAAAIAIGGGASALEAAGWIAYYRRRYDDARAFADAAANAAADDDELRTSALALAGRVRHGAGDLQGAVERLDAVASGSPSVRGVADVWMAGTRVHQGRPEDALAALARPMVSPDALAHPFAPMHLRLYRMMALGQLGRVGAALAVGDDLDAAVARMGPSGIRFAAIAANVSAWILRWTGRPDEADDRNRLALELTGGADGPTNESMAEPHYVSLLDLADGCLLRGDEAAADTLSGRLAAMDAWTGTMAWHQRHRLGLVRARLALADGDVDRAAELASAVAADAAARGAGRYEILARAITALADPPSDDEALSPVVEGIARCATLDGWPLLARLSSARGVGAWREQAERLAAVVVAGTGVGAHADAARAFADRVLATS